MKLKANTDTVALLKAAQKCRGEVVFKTREGDRLNLKSTLSSYVFCVALASKEIIESGHIELTDPGDRVVFNDFIID